MGLIRDTLLLRQYLRAKALSNLIDDLEEGDGKSKKGRKPKRVQREENTERHLGFWDFLDKQIQDEKKEEKEAPQSWKEMAKSVIPLILFIILMFIVLLLIDLYQRHVGSANPIFG